MSEKQPLLPGVPAAPSAVQDGTKFGVWAVRGVEQNGAFFRKGVVGDWPATLTPEMDAMVRDELGWMFPLFGWQA